MTVVRKVRRDGRLTYKLTVMTAATLRSPDVQTDRHGSSHVTCVTFDERRMTSKTGDGGGGSESLSTMELREIKH